jgi:hypothetical protein
MANEEKFVSAGRPREKQWKVRRIRLRLVRASPAWYMRIDNTPMTRHTNR